MMAEGVSTWQHSTLKFFSCSASASLIATAVGGVVVSKPMAKNTTSLPGLSRAIFRASVTAYTMRMSPPRALAFIRDRLSEAGMRTVSA